MRRGAGLGTAPAEIRTEKKKEAIFKEGQQPLQPDTWVGGAPAACTQRKSDKQAVSQRVSQSVSQSASQPASRNELAGRMLLLAHLDFASRDR